MAKDLTFSRQLRISSAQALRLMLKLKVPRVEIRDALQLSEPTLSKYLAGKESPREERALRIIENSKELIKEKMNEIVEETIKPETGRMDTDLLFSKYPEILTLVVFDISFRAYRIFRESIHKILTPAIEGIPFAAGAAAYLDRGLVIARKALETRTDSSEHVSGQSPHDTEKHFYVPRHILSRGENILVVDDFTKTGHTVTAMLDLVDRADCELAGYYSVFVIGDEWKTTMKLEESRFAFWHKLF